MPLAASNNTSNELHEIVDQQVLLKRGLTSVIKPWINKCYLNVD